MSTREDLDAKVILHQTGSTGNKLSRAAEAEARHVVLFELAVKKRKHLGTMLCDITCLK